MVRKLHNFDEWIDYFRYWQDSIGLPQGELRDFKFEAKFGDQEVPHIEFGHYKGQRKWPTVMHIPDQRIRDALMNLIVYQGDTEFASVEQQRNLLTHAPSDYDLLALMRVMTEEMRHGWQMSYLLCTHFGDEGKREAAKLLERRADEGERLLGSFNEPVVHQLVERPEQPLPLVGPALEQLRRLALSLVAEMTAQQVRHLPAMAHFLGHHAHQRQQIVVGGGVREQVALLLHRRELRVALVYDQVQERVPDPLVGDMHHGRPFALAFVMAELDVRYFLLPELCLELELSNLALGQADRILPVAEVVDPFIEVAELPDRQRLLLAGDASAMRWRASGVANSSVCCAISRSSMPASELASLDRKSVV